MNIKILAIEYVKLYELRKKIRPVARFTNGVFAGFWNNNGSTEVNPPGDLHYIDVTNTDPINETFFTKNFVPASRGCE